MENIPIELKINFICYQNLKNDMLDMRLINKEFKSIMDKNITMDNYPNISNESLTQCCLMYKSFMNNIKLIEESAAIEFDKMNIEMLIDNGWI
jgi:hypothetical protein